LPKTPSTGAAVFGRDSVIPLFPGWRCRLRRDAAAGCVSDLEREGRGVMATLPRKPRITAAQRRRLNLRDELWPDVTEDELWSRTDFTGFTTIPRTLLLISRIIDSLDKKTAGRVYIDLWCRAFDDYVIEVRDEYEAAFASGYEGQRAIRTWRERLDVLERLGFIRTKKTPHGAYRYVLILEPHQVIADLQAKGKLSEEASLALKAQLLSIGANREARLISAVLEGGSSLTANPDIVHGNKDD
jgi:hypothetical protein